VRSLKGLALALLAFFVFAPGAARGGDAANFIIYSHYTSDEYVGQIRRDRPLSWGKRLMPHAPGDDSSGRAIGLSNVSQDLLRLAFGESLAV